MCSSKQVSEYFNKLSEECKERYLSKISIIDNEDPYALPRDVFSEEDPYALPRDVFSEDLSILPPLR